MQLLQTWRWFGPNDPVTLSDIKQTGAQGIVTALHHIPYGDVWPIDEIERRQAQLKSFGFEWSVVESLNVHEAIKTRTGNYLQYIENYKLSLRNLAVCGIKTVTYNFMPVNDWTRTDIGYKMTDGSLALYFNWVDLAVFDIYVLKRQNAEISYPDAVLQKAAAAYRAYTQQQLEGLTHTILFGIPGEEKRTVAEVRHLLNTYKEIDHETLKGNLKFFLQQVAPVAAECGINLAIHPDDPPFDILGLPRIVCTQNDLTTLLSFTQEASNGICFCTGSLGAHPDNDLPQMIKAVKGRIHFIHLRNVIKDAEGNFYESDHLAGDVDMYAVMRELLTIQKPIPYRPDHGHQMLDDLNKRTNPGYSAIGRLRGLAELRGLEMGILRSIQKHQYNSL